MALIYVDSRARGKQTGQTWVDAFTTLECKKVSVFAKLRQWVRRTWLV